MSDAGERKLRAASLSFDDGVGQLAEALRFMEQDDPRFEAIRTVLGFGRTLVDQLHTQTAREVPGREQPPRAARRGGRR
jgi:hypothetical protein